MMRQFHDAKRQHPDKILFFRMGDFYEMFGDDAVKAAPILQIADFSEQAAGRSNSNVRCPLSGL